MTQHLWAKAYEKKPKKNMLIVYQMWFYLTLERSSKLWRRVEWEVCWNFSKIQPQKFYSSARLVVEVGCDHSHSGAALPLNMGCNPLLCRVKPLTHYGANNYWWSLQFIWGWMVRRTYTIFFPRAKKSSREHIFVFISLLCLSLPPTHLRLGWEKANQNVVLAMENSWSIFECARIG